MNLKIEQYNGVLVGGLSNFVGNALMFASVILMTRMFSVEDYGEFRYLFSYVSIFVLIGLLGRDSSIVYLSQNAKRSDFSGEFWAGLCNLFIVLILLLTFKGFILEYVLGGQVSSQNYVLAILMIPLWGAFNMILPLIKVEGGVNYSQVLSNFLQRAARVILLVLFCFILGGPDAMYFGMLSSQVLMICLALWFLWGRRRLFKFKWSYGKNFKYSAQLALNAGLLVLLGRIDVLMLGSMGGAEAVAYYDIAYLLASVVLIPFVALVKTSEVALQVERFSIGVYRKSLVVAALMSLPVVCLLFYGDDFVLGFFGDSYKFASDALRVLSIGFFVFLLLGAPLEKLNMNSRAFITSVLLVIAVIIDVALNSRLIPVLGGVGAAYSTVVSLIIVKLFAHLVLKLVGVRDFFGIPFVVILLCFIIFFIGYLMPSHWQFRGIVISVFSLVVSVVLFIHLYGFKRL